MNDVIENARAWNAASASDASAIGDTSSASTRLGQSPLRSPSVFNFFRPGDVPPNGAIANAALVAPYGTPPVVDNGGPDDVGQGRLFNLGFV